MRKSLLLAIGLAAQPALSQAATSFPVHDVIPIAFKGTHVYWRLKGYDKVYTVKITAKTHSGDFQATLALKPGYTWISASSKVATKQGVYACTDDLHRVIFKENNHPYQWQELTSKNFIFTNDLSRKQGASPVAKHKKKAPAKKKKSATKPRPVEYFYKGPLTTEEWIWLEKPQRHEYHLLVAKIRKGKKSKRAEADAFAFAYKYARQYVLKNLEDRPEGRTKYEGLIHDKTLGRNPRRATKLLTRLLKTVPHYKDTEIVLNEKEQDELKTRNQLGSYTSSMKQAQGDPIHEHFIVKKYRAYLKTPQTSPTATTPPGAEQKKKEEAKEEWKNALHEDLVKEGFLTKDQWTAYQKEIQKIDALPNLSDHDRNAKKDEVVKKILGELALAKYSGKWNDAQVARLLDRPNGLLDDNNFLKHAICDPLNNRPTTGKVAGKEVKKPLPQLKATAASSNPKMLDGTTRGTAQPSAAAEKPSMKMQPPLTAAVPTVPAGPPLVGSKSALARKCADPSIYAPATPASTEAPMPKPKPAVNKDARSKLKGAIKTGLIGGGIPGGLIGSFFGPWGVVAGVGIGVAAVGLLKWFSD